MSQSEKPRKSRRVIKPAKEGVDPNPSHGELAGEDDPRSWGDVSTTAPGAASENDERLKRDKPPHWA